MAVNERNMANRSWGVERVLPEVIRKTRLVSVAGDNSREMDLVRRAFDLLPKLGWITAHELGGHIGGVFRGRSEDFDKLDWRMAEPEGLGWRTSFEVEVIADRRRGMLQLVSVSGGYTNRLLTELC